MENIDLYHFAWWQKQRTRFLLRWECLYYHHLSCCDMSLTADSAMLTWLILSKFQWICSSCCELARSFRWSEYDRWFGPFKVLPEMRFWLKYWVDSPCPFVCLRPWYGVSELCMRVLTTFDRYRPLLSLLAAFRFWFFFEPLLEWRSLGQRYRSRPTPHSGF